MEKTPEYALEAGIAIWVEDNQDLVRCAIRLGTESTSLGLVDTNTNSFMQIVPTEVFGADGNLVHECFLNINHQAWGYYKIAIEDLFKFRVIEPKMARTQDTDIILFSEDEVINYLKKLASSLDIHYELDDALLNENYGKAETLINEMLHDYHVKMKEPLAEIKNIIDTFNGVIAIKATNTDDIENVRSLSSRYDLALLHPENWVVVESDGINGQDWLHSWLRQFQISESKEASLLYFAQKIVVGEYKKELIVHTNSVEPETDLTAPVLVDAALDLVLVRPVVHATRFEIVR
jgi:predicted nucleic acid-binding protein